MNKEQYDVIIVGAGIGGLICGCLLVKFGLKVLISEKTSKPGGYCVSFKTKNYEFDAFVHAFGNLSENAQFNNVLKKIGVYENIDFIRYDPTDTIITPDFKVSYWSSVDKTVDDFCRVFPDEAKQIDFFFNYFIKEKGLNLIQETRNKTFRDILDSIFKNDKLKATLSIVILGNLGTPSMHINAVTAIKHYRQFMIDGGYYPRLGAQVVSDTLASKFIEMGGKLILSDSVVKIFVKDETAVGVKLYRGRSISSKIVVSDCDARITFLDLIGYRNLKVDFTKKIKSMLPSLSLFMVYIGYKRRNNNLPKNGVNTWMISDYQYEKIHKININYSSESSSWIMARVNSMRQNCIIYSHAPFKTPNYWKKNRKIYMLNILKRALRFYPKLLESCDFLNSMDPSVLNRWTMNFNGAGYGWAATPEQFMDVDFTRDKIIKNLFLCGHWSTIAQGVEGVAIVGERVANIISNCLKHSKNLTLNKDNLK